jgi:3-oxoacyl-[acyl-carrier protein] reductase
LAQLPRDKVAAIIERLPVPRFARAEDITNVIDFFLSDQSDYVTAQTVWLGGVN